MDKEIDDNAHFQDIHKIILNALLDSSKFMEEIQRLIDIGDVKRNNEMILSINVGDFMSLVNGEKILDGEDINEKNKSSTSKPTIIHEEDDDDWLNSIGVKF